MLKSGKTPLLRAHQLEKMFNVGEIYIKLEGTNPTGHKHDRIAEILVKDAKAHGHECIIVNGTYSYINSVKTFAEMEGLQVQIPLFKNERWKTNRFDKAMTIDLKGTKLKSQNNFLNEMAEETGCYLAVEGYSNMQLSQMTLEDMTEEFISKLDYRVDNIYTQLSYGYTLTSIYSVLLKNWIDEKFDSFPKIVCGTLTKGNPIYEYYEKKNNIKERTVQVTESNDLSGASAVIDKQLLEESIRAVVETKGEIVSVDEALLKESAKMLRKHEHIKVSTKEAHSFAAFYQMVKNDEVAIGKHVIILNEGKSEVKLENIHDFEDVSKKKLVDFTKTWLAQYSDSTLETEEAIQNAAEKGFILLASRNEVYEGICIVVNIGFENFIPKYHLAYVGTNKKSKGRGVGTELIQQALDLTGGNLSLHVDLDNRGAKKLYEKLGFKHMYNRMIYYDRQQQ